MRPRGCSTESAGCSTRDQENASSVLTSNGVDSRFVKYFALLALPLVGVAACGSTTDNNNDSSDGGVLVTDANVPTGSRIPAPIKPAAACDVTIDAPVLLPALHVPEGSVITWNSNPPSSGTHYPVWADFKEYDKPIERGYTVHDIEHGAVDLFYRCDLLPTGTDCETIKAGLREVRDSIPTDDLCVSDIRVRVVIAPDPLLDVPVAAATWGWTYKAACLDLPTLKQFANDHYKQGPENFCNPGRTF